MFITDYERNIKLLNERIEWYEENRKQLTKKLQSRFYLNLVSVSSGVVIGAVLMYIFYRCPS